MDAVGKKGDCWMGNQNGALENKKKLRTKKEYTVPDGPGKFK